MNRLYSVLKMINDMFIHNIERIFDRVDNIGNIKNVIRILFQCGHNNLMLGVFHYFGLTT